MMLQEAFARFLPQIEKELQSVVHPLHPASASYFDMMRYHLGWLDEQCQPIQAKSGKRLRPILCVLCAQAASGDPQQALPAAAALELIHNFSLVHDDIQDRSHSRRGRRAVWDIWGAAHGINVGDGLFVLARLALHRLADRGVPPIRQQSSTLVLDRACMALCEGQYMDMMFESRIDVDEEEYLDMIRLKTGSLLAASAQIGALLATDDATRIEQFRQFAENLGLAFQIEDDILGVWGDEAVTGKSAATDIRDKKKALPAVYALNQQHDVEAAQQLAELYRQSGPLDEAAIHTALQILERVGARPYAEARAADYYHRALEHLRQSGCSDDALAALRELAASLVGRQA